MTAEPLVQAGQGSSPAMPGPEFVRQAEAVLAAGRELCEAAADGPHLMNLVEATAVASMVEDLSRITQYLQLAMAGAVDRHRPADAYGVAANHGGSRRGNASSGSDNDRSGTGSGSGAGTGGGAVSRLRFREFRSTADFLRARLRISRAEAKRRLDLAAVVLPGNTVAGDPLPLPFPRLAAASADGVLSGSGIELIANALQEAQPRLQPEALVGMERQLTEVGSRQDHDFLVRTVRHWQALLDQERPPSEDELSRFQGIFPGRRRNGLNHLHIYCTDEQHEALTAAMNGGANPRATNHSPVGASRDVPSEGAPSADLPSRSVSSEGRDTPSGLGPAGNSRGSNTGRVQDSVRHTDGSAADGDVYARMPAPSRPQQLLDGLLRAARAALAGGGLPASGGLRPQVMVTISYEALLAGLAGRSGKQRDDNQNCAGNNPGNKSADAPNRPGNSRRPDIPDGPGVSSGTGTPRAGVPSSGLGLAAFSGPIPAEEVRRLACDADLIPAVLGAEGQVLDLGRAGRLFPPSMRKALHARDRGCAFPGCTIPGPWAEAHHVVFWERGGGTGVGNGVLLCSFHHHLVHQGNWEVIMRDGTPWFRPPDYVDPDRRLLRNTYFHAEVPLLPLNR